MASTAITPITLPQDAFARKVIEDGLRVAGPLGGYLFAARQGKKDDELFRTANNPWWVHQGRYVLTQDNVAGGALALRISPPNGSVLRLQSLYALNTASAGSVLYTYLMDEDGAEHGKWAELAAGASSYYRLPSIGTVASVSSNVTNSLNALVPSGCYVLTRSSVALQTEYLTVAFAFLSESETFPTVTTTGSSGTPNLGANTISEANRTTMVVMP